MAEGQQTIGETLERADVLATGESIARVQDRSGAIAWPDGHVDAWDHVECAMALSVCGPRPDWELAADQLGHLVARHPEAFADKSRFAMDWYYPVLGGAVRGADADRRVASGWDTFVVPGLGVRCVSDEPWVTAAETCEL